MTYLEKMRARVQADTTYVGRLPHRTNFKTRPSIKPVDGRPFLVLMAEPEVELTTAQKSDNLLYLALWAVEKRPGTLCDDRWASDDGSQYSIAAYAQLMNGPLPEPVVGVELNAFNGSTWFYSIAHELVGVDSSEVVFKEQASELLLRRVIEWAAQPAWKRILRGPK